MNTHQNLCHQQLARIGAKQVMTQDLWNLCDSHTCGLCHTAFAVDEFVDTLNCKHHFHQSCILRWFAANNSGCPSCVK